MIKKLLYIFFALGSLSNCKEPQYNYTDAVVYKSGYNAHLKTYYHLTVFYTYYVDNQLYYGEDCSQTAYEFPSKWKLYDTGDTIIIKYQKDKPQKSFLYGLTTEKYNQKQQELRGLWNKKTKK